MVGGNADLFCPDIICLVVVFKNRDIKLILRHLQYLCKELPGPGGRVAFKVIAERKVAEHFKKRTVARRDAHTLDVRRTDTLLAGCDALSRRRNLPGKELFHRRHTGIDKQQAFIVLRYERIARKAEMPLAFKKGKKFFPQLIESCPFHNIISCSFKLRQTKSSCPKYGARA